MNNAAVNMSESGSVDVWIFTGAAAKTLLILSVGSEKAVLTWDTKAKTIALRKVDKKNVPSNAIFEGSVLDIEKAAFFRTVFYLTIQGVRYQMTLRDNKIGRGVMDARLLDTTGVVESVTAAHLDTKSDLTLFKDFLLVNNISTYQQNISAKMYLKVTIWIIVIAALLVFVGIAISYIAGMRQGA